MAASKQWHPHWECSRQVKLIGGTETRCVPPPMRVTMHTATDSGGWAASQQAHQRRQPVGGEEQQVSNCQAGPQCQPALQRVLADGCLHTRGAAEFQSLEVGQAHHSTALSCGKCTPLSSRRAAKHQRQLPLLQSYVLYRYAASTPTVCMYSTKCAQYTVIVPPNIPPKCRKYLAAGTQPAAPPSRHTAAAAPTSPLRQHKKGVQAISAAWAQQGLNPCVLDAAARQSLCTDPALAAANTGAA
jgi:hypothetical protein